MRFLKSFICLLLVLVLAGCGADADASKSPNKDSDEPGTTVSSEPAPVPQDMWVNAEGQYGTVSYTYDDKGNLTKTEFFLHSGKLWRSIEHSGMYDNAYGSNLQCQEIRNANGLLLFSLSYSLQDASSGDRKIPDYLTCYDYFLQTSSATVNYDEFGREEIFTYNNTFRGAQDYCVIRWKAAGQIEQVTKFNRDGSQDENWVMFYEDGKLAYIGVYAEHRYSTNQFYKAEYDSEGRISSLVLGTSTVNEDSGKLNMFIEGSSGEEILLSYDEAGRLVGVTAKQSSYQGIWSFIYEGDALAATEYLYDRYGYGEPSRGYYTFNSDGTLATADYGFLSGSLGGGDTSYYVFEYHSNGMFANIKGYFESAYNAGSDQLEQEWEYAFDVTGYKNMYRKYTTDYYFNPKYYEYTYDADGNKIGTVSGTYTEDGTLIPN